MFPCILKIKLYDFCFTDFIYNTLCSEKHLEEKYCFGSWPKLVGYVDENHSTKGQTALHLAIAREDEILVKEICQTIHNNSDLQHILSQCARGKDIPDVCFYGGTPIVTAILTGNINIIMTLLSYGAKLEHTDDTGENFWHSYVRYANAHGREDDEVADMREILKGIGKDNREKALALTKQESQEGFTPLLLAYHLSSRKMVESITDLGHKRIFHQRGLFDVEAYDVRRVDTITNHISRVSPRRPGGAIQRKPSHWHFFRERWRPQSVSGLEMLYSNSISNSQQIDMMQYRVIRYMVEQKWEMYRAFICTLGIIFLSMMVIITNYSGERNHEHSKMLRSHDPSRSWIRMIKDEITYHGLSTNHTNETYWADHTNETHSEKEVWLTNNSSQWSKRNHSSGNDTTVPAFNKTHISFRSGSQFLIWAKLTLNSTDEESLFIRVVVPFIIQYTTVLAFGTLNYILCMMLLLRRFVLKPSCFSYCLHNLDYLVLYCIFSHSLLLDSVCTALSLSTVDFDYEGGFLYIALITGWLFTTFFSRVFLRFGQIVDLIRRVVREDLLDFLSLMFILIVSFSTYFHHIFKYTTDESGNRIAHKDFFSLSRTLFSLFSLTLGQKDIDMWQDAENPWIAVTLLIVFEVITFLLLLNSLIAVMTNKCSDIFANQEDNLKLHRLSCILFIEDLFLLPHFLRPMKSVRVKQIFVKGKPEPVFEICLKRKRPRV